MSKKSRERRERVQRVIEEQGIEVLRKSASLLDRMRSTYERASKIYHRDPFMEMGDEIIFSKFTDAQLFIADNVYEIVPPSPPMEITEWGLSNLFPPFEEIFIEWGKGECYIDSCDAVYVANRAGVYIQRGDDECTYLLVAAFVDWDGEGHVKWEDGESSISKLGSGVLSLDDTGRITEVDSDLYMKKRYLNEAYRFRSVLYTALMALNLINARNIELVDAPPPDPDLDRKYQKHFGAPMTRYKVLRIKPTRKQYDSEGDESAAKRDLPLHLVRGHFRDSGDHPIPQFAGVRWIRAHVKGDEKHGVVVKDYKVDAPTDTD